MRPKPLLHLEGAVLLAAAGGAFLAGDYPLWPFLVGLLAPDLGMAGYLSDPRVGAWTYNALHTYPLPAALLGAGVYATVPLAVAFGLAWLGHIGADRALGYGLKYESDFHDTHLGRV